MIPFIESETLNYIPPSRDCFSLYAKFCNNGIRLERHGLLGGPEDAWSALCSDAGAWLVRGFGIWVIQCKSSHMLLGTTGFWQSKSKSRVFVFDPLPYLVNEVTKHEIIETMRGYSRERFDGLGCIIEHKSNLQMEIF